MQILFYCRTGRVGFISSKPKLLKIKLKPFFFFNISGYLEGTDIQMLHFFYYLGNMYLQNSCNMCKKFESQPKYFAISIYTVIFL